AEGVLVEGEVADGHPDEALDAAAGDAGGGDLLAGARLRRAAGLGGALEGPAQGAEPRAHEPLPSLQGTVHCLLGLKSRGGRVMNARRASALRSPLGRNALHTEGMSRSRPVLATAPRVQAPFSLALCKARGMEQRRSLLPPLRRGEDGGGG